MSYPESSYIKIYNIDQIKIFERMPQQPEKPGQSEYAYVRWQLKNTNITIYLYKYQGNVAWWVKPPLSGKFRSLNAQKLNTEDVLRIVSEDIQEELLFNLDLFI